jgi:hypothetical protein
VPTSDAGVAALGLPAHAAYACRHSGVCCSSGWEIPVEAALHDRLAAALEAGHVQPRVGPGLVARPDLPPAYRSVLGRHHGRCVFYTAGHDGCRLHGYGGAGAKPIACQQFPWLAVHDPRGTFVSLSHVCPTAAGLLHDPSLLVVTALPRAAASFEGLDVRRALPPAIGPRRLADWDALTAWETQALDACARAASPPDVLDDLIALHRHALRWAPGAGVLADWIGAWTPDPHRARRSWQPDPALDALVRDAVPDGLLAPPAAEAVPAPQWLAGGVLVRRYLAARVVACWPLHYGAGLPTAIAYVAALLSVLAGELARHVRPGALVDDAATLAAIAETDRLVVHLAAPDALARGLDAWAAWQLDL